MRFITAKPANGKDYITPGAVKQAWAAGEEFLIIDTQDYISRDTQPQGTEVRIRYDRGRSVVRVP